MYPLFQNNIQSNVFGYPIYFLPKLGAKLVNRNRYDLISVIYHMADQVVN